MVAFFAVAETQGAKFLNTAWQTIKPIIVYSLFH